MKQGILILLSISFVKTGMTQFTYNYLDENMTKAFVTNGGVFFNNLAMMSGGLEYPVNSGNTLIYSSAFWFGGEDINGQLKLSAQMYENGVDLFKGAITKDGTASAPVSPYAGELYAVTKAEIDYHIANYMNIGYVVPASILNWPAHGDVAQNLDYYLAPFVDVNGDLMYNPALGDYPAIRGDRAIYLIMNDKGNIHSGSNGDPLGIECHFMFYQYDSAGVLGNTTFVHLQLINRGTQTLYNYKTGLFVDPDVGDFSDDYVGCDSSRNLMYSYNADAVDDIYGANPPAVGIVSLNTDMGTFGTFAQGGSWDPSFAPDYWKYMNGLWLDSNPFTYGGNGYGGVTQTQFMFSGNPNDAGQWSEVSAGTVPGDRRMYLTTAGITLMPSQQICYDFAFVVADEGTPLENVDALIADADSLTEFFNAQTNFQCYSPIEQLAINETEKSPIKSIVYPNPAVNEIYIRLNGSFEINIFAADGKLVFQQSNLDSSQPIPLNLLSGSYIAVIKQGDQLYREKIVIR